RAAGDVQRACGEEDGAALVGGVVGQGAVVNGPRAVQPDPAIDGPAAGKGGGVMVQDAMVVDGDRADDGVDGAAAARGIVPQFAVVDDQGAIVSDGAATAAVVSQRTAGVVGQLGVADCQRGAVVVQDAGAKWGGVVGNRAVGDRERALVEDAA